MYQIKKFEGPITKEVIATKTAELKFESAVAAVATSKILEDVSKQIREKYAPEIEESGEYRGVKVAAITLTKYEFEDAICDTLKDCIADMKAALAVMEKRLELRQETLILEGKATPVLVPQVRVTIAKK